VAAQADQVLQVADQEHQGKVMDGGSGGGYLLADMAQVVVVELVCWCRLQEVLLLVNGGAGLPSIITGTPATYAGGGGGGNDAAPWWYCRMGVVAGGANGATQEVAPALELLEQLIQAAVAVVLGQLQLIQISCWRCWR
jgi:hypothetical protein